MKPDKKKIRELAVEGLRSGKHKDQVYDEIMATDNNYQFHSEIAKIIQYIPEPSRLRRYGIYNTLMLILLILTDIASIVFMDGWTLAVPLIFTILVAMKKTRYYDWFIFIGALMIISVLAMSILEYFDFTGKDVLNIILAVVLAVIFILFGILMPRYLTPAFSVIEEKKTDENGIEITRKRIHFS